MAVAVVVSALWLAGAAALLATLGPDGAMWLAIAVAVALPLAVIWLAALLARQSAAFPDEAERSPSATEVPAASTPAHVASRQPPIRLTRPVPAEPPPPLQPNPATTLADVSADPTSQQQALPLGIAVEGPPVSLYDLVRALDFPDGPGDKDGFRALHRALGDPKTRRTIQASQDILTLLSEEGIYMDDLHPVRARPELWRRFADGERSAAVGTIGGIQDRSSLALTATRLRSDPVFRDAAHHFLRLFDRTLTEIAPEATDDQLAALTDTRSARAFMLVGRVTGMFG